MQYAEFRGQTFDKAMEHLNQAFYFENANIVGIETKNLSGTHVIRVFWMPKGAA